MSKHGSTRSKGTAPNDVETPLRLLKFMEVSNRVTLGRTEIYARIKIATFPRPVPLGLRRVAWDEREIVAWMEAIIAKRKAAA